MTMGGKQVEDVNLNVLVEVRSRPFQTKVLTATLISAFLALAVLLGSGWVSVVAMMLLGFMYAHAIELQHECIHNTAYRSRRWNRVAGVLLGLPMLVSFSDFQTSHLRHHRLLGTSKDKEFFGDGPESLTSVRKLILHMFMLRYYRGLARHIFKALVETMNRNGASQRMVRQVRFEYALMGVSLFAVALITVYFQTAAFLKLWLIPLLAAIPVHSLIEMPEHFGCDSQTTDVLKNTRSIKASKVAIWFTNGNNFHVEHHWLPSVPVNNLEKVHRLLEGRIKHYEPSYWSFYRKVFRRLLGAERPGS